MYKKQKIEPGSWDNFARRVKILIMDDDEDIRSTTGILLGKIGCEAGFARDGDEAVKLYKQAKDSKAPFDAVIMDLMICGGMGGKETIKELVKMDPGVKAIISSGHSCDSAMINPVKYGFSAALAKPYTIEELSETLHKAIAR